MPSHTFGICYLSPLLARASLGGHRSRCLSSWPEVSVQGEGAGKKIAIDTKLYHTLNTDWCGGGGGGGGCLWFRR